MLATYHVSRPGNPGGRLSQLLGVPDADSRSEASRRTGKDKVELVAILQQGDDAAGRHAAAAC